MKLKFDGFLLSLIGVLVLAALYPPLGAKSGILYPQLTNKIGVALIFLLHGIGLSFAALKAGTLHWRLHLLVQTCTFLLFPVLGLALFFGAAAWLSPELRLGLFFLCALPSTVSSSVALTAAAGGNVAAALFNATISSLIGVVVTPLWMSGVAASAGVAPDLWSVVVDLCLWLVLPLAVGQALRPLLGEWAKRNRARIHLVDRGTILFLVYTTFCDSFLEGVWSSHGFGTVIVTVAINAALFSCVMIVSGGVGRALGFSRQDRIATMFCASKKSMATGVPMAQLMFAQSAVLGVVVLPLLIYHTMQLVLAGMLAARWSREPTLG
jgi:solute carrier family 10 (sodium/bile acid cotransporter), member 7